MRTKLQLLAATAVLSAFGAGTAQAQTVYNSATFYGWGASLPANVVRQQLDCQGTKQVLAFRGGGTASIDDFNYDVPGGPGTVANPDYDCATKVVQPNLTGWYLSTGSGRGVDGWKAYDLTQQSVNPLGNFPSIQYALSETPLSSTNITQYNAGAKTTQNTGNPIQVPFIAVPVTIAYDPVYAKRRNGGGGIDSFTFNIKSTFARADGSGGLRLTKAAYCGIFNGTITNWNSPLLKTLNGNVSLKDPDDTTPEASWSVPIRLVGRSETSGTSSLWTRHLAAVCPGTKYVNSENKLPYDGSVVVGLSGTGYTGVASTINPTNSIRGTGYNKATDALVGPAEVPGDGLYTVADGSDGVAKYINRLPDPTATTGDTTFNGKIGYVGADYTLPASLNNLQNNFGLHTASLQIGGTTTYAAPTSATTIAAFGTGPTAVLPPQSKPTGVYDTTGTGSGGDRANPLAWVQGADKTVALANPPKGYPIVGTTNILLYTCYANANVRKAIVHWLGLNYGKVTKDSTGTTTAANIPAQLFTQPAYGELAKNGFSSVPTAFKTAIFETFMKKSVQASPAGVANQLGLRNLWIQDKLPTNAATYLEYNATSAKTGVKLNPTCTAGQGA